MMQTVQKEKGWEYVKLGNVITEALSGFACGKRDDNGIIQLRMNNIGIDGSLVLHKLLKVPQDLTDIKKYRLMPGDILFNNTNSPELIGKTTIFNDEIKNCVYSNHITRIRVDTKLALPKWIKLTLISEQKNGTFELMCHRFVGQAGISRQKLLDLEIPLPSLEEQKKIVQMLELSFARTDKAKAHLLEAKKSINNILQSSISKAIPIKDPLPKGWKWMKLGETCKVTSGGTPSRTKKEYWDGDIPWVKISDMRQFHIKYTKEKITKEGLDNSSTKIFPKGTLLFSVFATLGEIAILDIDAATNQAIAGIFINDEKALNKNFLIHYLQFIKQSWLEKSKGVTQNNINLTILKNLDIPVPPLEEQRQIVTFLNSVSEYTKSLKKTNHNSWNKLDIIKSSILSRAFSGKLIN